ncbi:hypothetical protein EVAR_67171_1 [Eumeta japonica]|uniref:Uncharacterized protein n=1 Tax=Eumeta variegata TaxID=151549 RepID=A0A4C1ZRM5_EUMVA|nr:hypothetical protein EVAR_67171_1 [Eumeta japonica]
MSDFQGLMMEPEGSDDGANFQLRYQTLKANHGQNVFHENINKSNTASSESGPFSVPIKHTRRAPARDVLTAGHYAYPAAVTADNITRNSLISNPDEIEVFRPV